MVEVEALPGISTGVFTFLLRLCPTRGVVHTSVLVRPVAYGTRPPPVILWW